MGFNDWISKTLMVEISNLHIQLWYKRNNVKGCFEYFYFHILILTKFWLDFLMKNAILPQCFSPQICDFANLANCLLKKTHFSLFSNGFPSFPPRKITKIMKLSYPKKHCFGNITNFQMIVIIVGIGGAIIKSNWFGFPLNKSH